MTDREANRILALMAGIAALAGPRRTRPLAGFLYGLWLSRAAGAAHQRLTRELLRLFDERNSVHRRLDGFERHVRERLGDLARYFEHDERRIEALEGQMRRLAANTFPLHDGPHTELVDELGVSDLREEYHSGERDLETLDEALERGMREQRIAEGREPS